MAKLVLVVLAGIIGFVGYDEAAKIEQRFRRGPLGLPARAWGVAGACAGLVGAVVAPALVAGALLGYVGYEETTRYAEQSEKDLLGFPPLGWAAVCFGFGTIGAITTSAFVVGVLAAFAGSIEVAMYERQYGRRIAGVSSPVWVGACSGFGVVGALVTSTSAWGVVCCVIGLVAALVLLVLERDGLISEKNALIAERDALVAERRTRRPDAAANGSASPVAPTSARPPARQAQPPAPAAAPGWSTPPPPAPRPVGAPASDFLPHRR